MKHLFMLIEIKVQNTSKYINRKIKYFAMIYLYLWKNWIDKHFITEKMNKYRDIDHRLTELKQSVLTGNCCGNVNNANAYTI